MRRREGASLEVLFRSNCANSCNLESTSGRMTEKSLWVVSAVFCAMTIHPWVCYYSVIRLPLTATIALVILYCAAASLTDELSECSTSFCLFICHIQLCPPLTFTLLPFLTFLLSWRPAFITLSHLWVSIVCVCVCVSAHTNLATPPACPSTSTQNSEVMSESA